MASLAAGPAVKLGVREDGWYRITQPELLADGLEVIFGGNGVKGQPLTIGEAAARAKARITDNDIRRTWMLLGDPSMKLR